jgi:putative hemolysin
MVGQRKFKNLKKRLSLVAPPKGHLTPHEVFTHILQVLGIEYELLGPAVQWPEMGKPLLLLANHPLGGIEAIVISALALSKRPDTELLYSPLLSQIEGLEDTILPISVEAGSEARAMNRSSLREAFRHLSAGGCLAMFPGGITGFRALGGHLGASVWSHHAADLAKKTGAVVIPIYFARPPKNRLSVIERELNPLPSLVSLFKEPVPKAGNIQLAMGWPIPNTVLKAISDRRKCVDFMQLASKVGGAQNGLLSGKGGILHAVKQHFWAGDVSKAQISLGPAVDPGLIEAELSSLPPGALLFVEGDFQVFYVEAADVPHTLRELGRLREYTFRSIGEGTGNAVDLDEFDEFYAHLLVWDQSARLLVGSYRMGRATGQHTMYVETLFRLSKTLKRRLNNALELGRSFITPEYQVRSGVLNLMWKGIAKVVAQNPGQPLLYGPVSLSAHYHPASMALMLHYLKLNHFDKANARHVRAPVPPKWPKTFQGIDVEGIAASVRTFEQLSSMVSALEKDGKGIPPLIKHYSHLGGRFLGFGVDVHFGNAVDALLLLDLRNSPLPLLNRFMGAAEARRFLEHQK